MEQGGLTREAALELIECLFLKATETVNLLEGIAAIAIGGNNTFIELTIGGVDRQGRDAVHSAGRNSFHERGVQKSKAVGEIPGGRKPVHKHPIVYLESVDAQELLCMADHGHQLEIDAL